VNDLFRQYMLTLHDDDERNQLRERLIADQELSDQLKDQEDNWIDSYAAGQLPPEDAALLHEHLAATGQLDRLATAVALASAKSAKRRSAMPFAIGIAAVFLIGLAIPILRTREPERVAVTFALHPGTLRGAAEIPKVTMTPDRPTALQLTYQDTAPTGDCVVAIKTADSVIKDESRKPCGNGFHTHTMTAPLPPGRYTADLSTTGGELLHTYLFDVSK